MLINELKFFVLMATLLLADYFFLNESIRLNIFLMAILVVRYIFVLAKSPIRLYRDTQKILGVAFLFLGYMFVVEIARGQDIYRAVVSLLSSMLIITMLPIFEVQHRQKSFDLIRQYKRLMIVSIAFGILQFAGFHLILIDFFPGIGPLGADRVVEEREVFINRTSGATSNIIAFAQHLMIFVLVGYISFITTRRLSAMLGLLIAVFVLITTQTRAAIVGIIPVLAMMEIMLARHRMRAGLRVVGVFIVVGLGYWLLGNLILEKMNYLSKEIDTSDTYRFWVNWYMSIGVLHESPLFGISPDQAWDIYLRYGDRTIHGYNPDMATPTHHNQLGYYLRYYGLIGLGLLGWLYTLIFIKSLHAKSLRVRLFLCSLFLVDLVYSMGHNNKLILTPLLWILLSLASINPVKGREPL